jgi:hypothetical protein
MFLKSIFYAIKFMIYMNYDVKCSVKDMLGNYLRSENKNVEQLIEYGEQLGNGAVFKRLGFLLEKKAPDEAKTIEK